MKKLSEVFDDKSMSGFWGRAFHCRNYYDIQLKRLCDGAMGLAAVQFDASPPFIVYYLTYCESYRIAQRPLRGEG